MARIGITTEFLEFIHRKISESGWIKAQDLSYLWFNKTGEFPGGGTIRAAINLLRTERRLSSGCLIAGNKGYCYTKDIVEILKYEKTLRSRYNEMRRVAYHIIKSIDGISTQQQTNEAARAEIQKAYQLDMFQEEGDTQAV